MDSKVIIVFLISCFFGALCQELCIDSCPANEVFSECKAGGICQKTCSTRNTTVVECDCVSGCICKPGYFRDANTYKCITKASCPPIPNPNSTICAKNEVYSKSLAGCQKNCYTRDIMYKCIPKSGCICADGYIRSPINNQCILIKSCDKCPIGYSRDLKTKRCELSCDICLDSNAEFNTCGDRCKELTCENPLLEGIVCPALEKCEPGCFCKAGYVKDLKTKKCILPKACPNPCKDINAAYSNCGTNSTCDMKTCRFPNGQADDCMKVCQKGCFCKPGYVKNDAGKCVLPKNCPIPICNKLNEIYDCRNPTCEPGCLIKTCMSVNCENKCYCRDGYVKEKGICVLLETCKKCDDPNSSYSNCKSECSVATCLNPSDVDPLCKEKPCVAGCFCKKGYVQDHTGKCVLPDKCPKCPYNESFSCGNAACEKNCGNLNETCIIQNIKCDNKCFCNKGFVRETPNGPCIPILKCPPNKCKINEVFECRNPTCDDEGCCIEKGRSCKDVPCENKCYCADGFVRIDGTCVSRDNCLKDVCPANEIMDCRNPTCLNEGCLISKRPCKNVPCLKRCYCADGFARIDGTCVPRQKCNEICDDPNSTFKPCEPTCEPTCKEPIPTICPINCVSGCVCNAGYIRDSNGTCIPIGSCPKPIVCPLYEVFACRHPTCGESGCFDQCLPDEDTPCVERCFCIDGFHRENGICIPKYKCPKEPITCLYNEVFACRDRPCSEPCPDFCEYKCYCAEGLFNIGGKCVPENKCPLPNTEYRKCVNPCTEPSCSRALVDCKHTCEDGCYCKKGFYKDEQGNCVEKCTKPIVCPKYEVLACRHPTCGENSCFDQCLPDEDTPCEERCFCAAGYYRENGICIPEYKCPEEPIICLYNEVFECRDPCSGRNCDASESRRSLCEYKCYCPDEFVNVKGICVPRNHVFP